MKDLFWDENKLFRSLSLLTKMYVIGKKFNHISDVLLEENRTLFFLQNSYFSRFLKNSQGISLLNLNLESFSFLLFHFFQREKAKTFHFSDKSECIFFTFHFSNTFNPLLLGRVLRTWVHREIVQIRVAELGNLSSGAKMAMEIFVNRVFTIFATNASFFVRNRKFSNLTQ